MPPGHTVAVGSDDSKKNTSFNIHRNKTDITDSLDLQLQRSARCLGNCFVCLFCLFVLFLLLLLLLFWEDLSVALFVSSADFPPNHLTE